MSWSADRVRGGVARARRVTGITGITGIVAVAALLTGCGGDAPGSVAAPTAAPSSTAGAAGAEGAEDPEGLASPAGPDGAGDPTARCDTVTSARLTDATGVAQEVLTDGEGSVLQCRTAFDERGMTIEWDVVPATMSFAEIGEYADLPGLERTRTTIGPARAWLLQGSVVGTRSVRLVLVVDGLKLEVDANDAADSSSTVTPAQLRAGARAVAESYL